MSSNTFRRGRRSIKVVATAGYDLENDELLIQAIGHMCNHWITYKKAVIQLAQGNQSITQATPKSIPDHVRDMVAPLVLWERQGDYRPM
jgi:hypothetical protein